MKQENAIKIFEDKKVRTLWDADQEKWYISIVDVIAILTGSVDAAAYWRKLKQRLKEEGNETVKSCHGLKIIIHLLVRARLQVAPGLVESHLDWRKAARRLAAKPATRNLHPASPKCRFLCTFVPLIARYEFGLSR